MSAPAPRRLRWALLAALTWAAIVVGVVVIGHHADRDRPCADTLDPGRVAAACQGPRTDLGVVIAAGVAAAMTGGTLVLGVQELSGITRRGRRSPSV